MKRNQIIKGWKIRTFYKYLCLYKNCMILDNLGERNSYFLSLLQEQRYLGFRVLLRIQFFNQDNRSCQFCFTPRNIQCYRFSNTDFSVKNEHFQTCFFSVQLYYEFNIFIALVEKMSIKHFSAIITKKKFTQAHPSLSHIGTNRAI